MRWIGCAALVLVLFLAASCSDGTGPEGLPATIAECETDIETYCAVWARADDEEYDYLAEWDQGTVAEVTVLLFRSDSVAFHRRDIAGPSGEITGEYRGARTGDAASGVVLFSNGRQHGWEAEW